MQVLQVTGSTPPSTSSSQPGFFSSIQRRMAETLGMDLHTLTWAVSKGTDIGGIATPIGAAANVTGVALAAKEGHPISWKRYCKYAMPAAVLVLVVSMVLILALH